MRDMAAVNRLGTSMCVISLFGSNFGGSQVGQQTSSKNRSTTKGFDLVMKFITK